MPDLSTEARARVEAAMKDLERAAFDPFRAYNPDPARAALLATVEAVVGEAVAAVMERLSDVECERVWIAAHGWGLTPGEMLGKSLVNGEMGVGRMNGFDDKPHDIVYRAPNGMEMTREMAQYWNRDWRSFQHGWTKAARAANAAPAARPSAPEVGHG